MKLFLLLLTTPALLADTTVLPIPETRGNADTAYAEWDSFDSLSASGNGSTNADFNNNMASAVLAQANPAASPGGRLGTAGDFRVYSGPTKMEWTVSAQSNIDYNTATFRALERLDFNFGGPDQTIDGLSQYSVNLNGQEPTSITVDTVTQVIQVLTFTFEIDLAYTTFTWNLAEPTDQVLIELDGDLDLHDSVDAFVLDLKTTPSVETPLLSTPEVSLEEGAVTVTWPTTPEGTLQISTNLADPESWVDVTTSPSVLGEINSLSFPLTTDPTFFRLRN